MKIDELIECLHMESEAAYNAENLILRDTLDEAAETIRVLDAVPAADVMEVVRCGECEYWDTTWNPKAAKNGEHYCPATDLFTTPNWFCADGERREVQDD